MLCNDENAFGEKESIALAGEAIKQERVFPDVRETLSGYFAYRFQVSFT